MQLRRRWYVDVRGTTREEFESRLAAQDRRAEAVGYVRIEALAPHWDDDEQVFPLVYEEAPKGSPVARNLIRRSPPGFVPVPVLSTLAAVVLVGFLLSGAGSIVVERDPPRSGATSAAGAALLDVAGRGAA